MLWLLEGFVVPGVPGSLVEEILRVPCLALVTLPRPFVCSMHSVLDDAHSTHSPAR
jgi:hypothetical protein